MAAGRHGEGSDPALGGSAYGSLPPWEGHPRFLSGGSVETIQVTSLPKPPASG